ncbi:MAG: hypothetical protein IIA75_06385, partial [Proteobacteria bacterium]|nr:hypothetical protein [Pseudomonadota bacterium]
MDFRMTSVVDLAEQVRSKKVSSRELTQAVLDNIERIDSEINSFCAINAEQALVDADEIDGLVAKGENLPLAGVPIGVKDLEDAKGFITTFGSALHVEDPVAATDSELVRRLKKAGCVVTSLAQVLLLYLPGWYQVLWVPMLAVKLDLPGWVETYGTKPSGDTIGRGNEIFNAEGCPVPLEEMTLWP